MGDKPSLKTDRIPIMNRPHCTFLAGAAVMAAAIMLFPRDVKPAPGASCLTTTVSLGRTASALDDLTLKTRRGPTLSNQQNLSDIPSPVESPYPPGASENKQWVEDQIDELNRLSALDDSTSLRAILAELRNPLPEIRRAAISAVRAFSSRESIPYLEQLRRVTADATDQQALTETIEHLKLPTMVEALEGLSIPTAAENQDSP